MEKAEQIRIKNLSTNQIDSMIRTNGRINVVLSEPGSEGAFIKRITLDDLKNPAEFSLAVKMYFIFNNSSSLRGGWRSIIKPEVFEGMDDAWSFNLDEYPNLIIANSDVTLYDLIK